MFRTITAKYHGICRRCNGPIAIGDKIRYAGPGRSYHLAADCPGSGAPAAAADDDSSDSGAAPAPALTISYGSTPISRVPARRGRGSSSYTRFSSGAEVFTNARGRCEDAPCCGCCS